MGQIYAVSLELMRACCSAPKATSMLVGVVYSVDLGAYLPLIAATGATLMKEEC